MESATHSFCLLQHALHKEESPLSVKTKSVLWDLSCSTQTHKTDKLADWQTDRHDKAKSCFPHFHTCLKRAQWFSSCHKRAQWFSSCHKRVQWFSSCHKRAQWFSSCHKRAQWFSSCHKRAQWFGSCHKKTNIPHGMDPSGSSFQLDVHH